MNNKSFYNGLFNSKGRLSQTYALRFSFTPESSSRFAPRSTKANSNIPKYELYKRTLIKANSQAEPGNQVGLLLALFPLQNAQLFDC
jgi:hypothetical protein